MRSTVLVVVALATVTVASGAQNSPAMSIVAAADYGNLPLSFEPNRGQISPRVKFLSRSNSGTVFLADDEIAIAARAFTHDATLESKNARIRRTPLITFHFAGANRHAQLKAEGLQQGVSNYIVGKDPGKWRTNVPNYARVRYHDLYPGVDLVFYGNQRKLEYDIVVSPGADATRVHFRLAGVERTDLDAHGNLVLHTSAGPVTQYLPRVYQNVHGKQVRINGRYVVQNDGDVSFALAKYDHARPLVIDPVIAYSTLLGGGFHEQATAVAVDTAGHAYVAGITESPDFPVTAGAFDRTCGTGPGQCSEPFFDENVEPHLYDAFVTKLNTTGTALLYSTFLGGDDADRPNGIVVDPAGNAYVTGTTSSSDFPGKPFNGSFTCSAGCFFVTKINPTGTSLAYSLLFQDTSLGAFAVNSFGQLYLAGATSAATFPTSTFAHQRTRRGPSDAFVAKLNSRGTAFAFSTLLGGSGSDNISSATLAASGNVLVLGSTDSSDFPITPGAFSKTPPLRGFFAAKLTPGGATLLYSTYLPPIGIGFYNVIGTDASENAYVVGDTPFTTFFTTPGAFQRTLAGEDDGVAIKLDPTGSRLLYATYFGGGSRDRAFLLAVTASGKATIGGFTDSSDFPITKDALEPESAGPSQSFLLQLNSSATGLVTSTFLNGAFTTLDFETRGSTLAMATDQFGGVYLAGIGNMGPTLGAFQTTSTDFGDNAFVTKIIPLCGLSPTNRIVTICTPNNGSTVSSPVRIIAGSTDDVHVASMDVFVDGVRVYRRTGESSVYVHLPMRSGTHRVTVTATDLNNIHFWRTVNLTVK